jgi:hypothetical protein
MQTRKPADRRSPGRPSLQSGRTPNFSVRLPSKLVADIGAWGRRQQSEPNRNESIRWLLEFALALDPKMEGEEKR